MQSSHDSEAKSALKSSIVLLVVCSSWYEKPYSMPKFIQHNTYGNVARVHVPQASSFELPYRDLFIDLLRNLWNIKCYYIMLNNPYKVAKGSLMLWFCLQGIVRCIGYVYFVAVQPYHRSCVSNCCGKVT